MLQKKVIDVLRLVVQLLQIYRDKIINAFFSSRKAYNQTYEQTSVFRYVLCSWNSRLLLSARKRE